jgi:hypothetical protein
MIKTILLSTLSTLTLGAGMAQAYTPIVTCESNYRQAPYEMACWSTTMETQTNIGHYVRQLERGSIARPTPNAF